MHVQIEPGHYVVAVSGGVDSVVLLNVLARVAKGSEGENGIRLTVAHFDHGIRPDSGADRQFVQELAANFALPFVYGMGYLGPTASESDARDARYVFLRKVLRASSADAIMTAHHQDDLLETAIINLQRGTGRKGLSSLGSGGGIVRPLLHIPKRELVAYAKDHDLEWREDSTNQDQAYTRNRIRHSVMPKLGDEGRQKLVDIIERMRLINQQIDECIIDQLHQQPAVDLMSRHYFIMLPHTVAREVMAVWLRGKGIGFDAKMIEKAVWAAKTFAPGKRIDINYTYALVVGKHNLALTARDR